MVTYVHHSASDGVWMLESSRADLDLEYEQARHLDQHEGHEEDAQQGAPRAVAYDRPPEPPQPIVPKQANHAHDPKEPGEP